MVSWFLSFYVTSLFACTSITMPCMLLRKNSQKAFTRAKQILSACPWTSFLYSVQFPVIWYSDRKQTTIFNPTAYVYMGALYVISFHHSNFEISIQYGSGLQKHTTTTIRFGGKLVKLKNYWWSEINCVEVQ